MVSLFFSLIVKTDKTRDNIDMQKGEFCMVIKSSLGGKRVCEKLGMSRKMLHDCQ